MRRLLLSFSVIAVACSTSTQQAKEIPATTKSDEARRHYERGLALSENVRVAEAIEEFALALKVDPGFVSARALLAFHTPGEAGLQQLEQVNQQTNDLPEAERTFVRMLRAKRGSDAKEAVAEARKLVALVPESPRARTELGQALVTIQDYSAAATEAQKAIELNARFGPALNMLGYAMLQQGRMPEAIEALQRYAAVMPQEPNAQDSLGDALLAAGRYTDAEATFRKAVEISPTFWNGYEGIACAKFYQRDFAGAREAFENGRKVASRPGDRATLEAVAAFEALAEDKPADAMKILDAIERIPNIPPDRLAVLPIARAVVLLHTRRMRDALSELDKMTPLWSGGTLPPPVSLQLRLYTLAVRAAVEATMKDVAAVGRTATAIRQDAVANPDDKMAQSALHFAMGMQALAKGDRSGALTEWAHCLTDDTLCQGYLAMNAPDSSAEPAHGTPRTIAPRPATRGYVNARDPFFLYLSSRRPTP
jgi:tetratricopeptide (TPR) repeat protein